MGDPHVVNGNQDRVDLFQLPSTATRLAAETRQLSVRSTTVPDILVGVLEKTSGEPPGGIDVLAADLLRGHTDTIVLGVLHESDSYGFEIFKRIRGATGDRYEIKEATLYATYRRLARDGLVEAYWGDETQGARRKYYRITDAGRAVFRLNVAAWAVTRDIIDSLLDLDRSAGRVDAASGRQSS